MKPLLRILRAATLSPAGLLGWAACILAFHWMTHLLDWRESATILTGTIPNGSTAEAAALKAVLYLAGHFGAVLISPILMLAAGLSALWLKMAAKNQGRTP